MPSAAPYLAGPEGASLEARNARPRRRGYLCEARAARGSAGVRPAPPAPSRGCACAGRPGAAAGRGGGVTLGKNGRSQTRAGSPGAGAPGPRPWPHGRAATDPGKFRGVVRGLSLGPGTLRRPPVPGSRPPSFSDPDPHPDSHLAPSPPVQPRAASPLPPEGRGHAGRGGARPGQRRGTLSAEPASRGALAFAPRTPSPARPCAPRPVPAAFCAEQGTRRLAGGAAPLPPAAGPGQPAAWLVAVRTGPPGTAQAFGGAGLAYTKQVPTLPFMCICQKVLMYELGGHVHKCLYSTF